MSNGPAIGVTITIPIMRRWLIFFLICSGPIGVSAGTDSLLSVLRQLPDGPQRLPVLTELVRHTVFGKPDTALLLAAEYLAIAERSGGALEVGKGHNYAGMCWSVKGEQDRALEHYLQALSYFERADDPWYVAVTYNNVGSVHEKEKRWADATRAYTTALEGFTAVGDSVWMASIANNLGNVDFGQERYADAARAYARADTVFTATGNWTFAASARMNAANAVAEAGDLPEAMRLLRSALAVSRPAEDAHTHANILGQLGRHMLRVGKLDSASVLLHESLALATAVGARQVQVVAHGQLVELFESLGRCDSALWHLRQGTALSDSLHNEQRTALISEMHAKYESGKKDALIAENEALLARRTLVVRAITAVGILLAVVALLAYRAYRLKKRSSDALAHKNAVIDRQLKEKELLLREVHHRVKNNLQTVSSLLSLQSRNIRDAKAREAVLAGRQRVRSMALIHRDLYREGDLTGVRMPAYVEQLIEGLLKGYDARDRIAVDMEVAPISLDVDTAVPIGLILNELITNALKHAWPLDATGKLTVRLVQRNDALQLVVKDDGSGCDPALLGDDARTGFGLGMVRGFAAKLQAEWTITADHGTSVELWVRKFDLAG